MEPQAESTDFVEWVRSVEPWVWPATAAVLMAGSIVIGSMSDLIRPAARPGQLPIVIYMPRPAERAFDTNRSIEAGTNALENRPNVPTD